MSPATIEFTKEERGFPRMRGDEPVLEYTQLKENTFSPHTRG